MHRIRLRARPRHQPHGDWPITKAIELGFVDISDEFHAFAKVAAENARSYDGGISPEIEDLLEHLLGITQDFTSMSHIYSDANWEAL